MMYSRPLGCSSCELRGADALGACPTISRTLSTAPIPTTTARINPVWWVLLAAVLLSGNGGRRS